MQSRTNNNPQSHFRTIHQHSIQLLCHPRAHISMPLIFWFKPSTRPILNRLRSYSFRSICPYFPLDPHSHVSSNSILLASRPYVTTALFIIVSWDFYTSKSCNISWIWKLLCSPTLEKGRVKAIPWCWEHINYREISLSRTLLKEPACREEAFMC